MKYFLFIFAVISVILPARAEDVQVVLSQSEARTIITDLAQRDPIIVLLNRKLIEAQQKTASKDKETAPAAP